MSNFELVLTLLSDLSEFFFVGRKVDKHDKSSS